MDWLNGSLPVVLVLLLAPLMILLMVDGLNRSYSGHNATARRPEEGRVLLMKRSAGREPQPHHPSKKAA